MKTTKQERQLGRNLSESIPFVGFLLEDFATLEAHVAALEKKLEWYQSGDIHTCHDECKRPICVVRRENAALEARCEKLEASNSRLEHYRNGLETKIGWQSSMLERAKGLIDDNDDPHLHAYHAWLSDLSKGPGNE